MKGQAAAHVGMWSPGSPVAVGLRCFQFQFMLSRAANGHYLPFPGIPAMCSLNSRRFLGFPKTNSSLAACACLSLLNAGFCLVDTSIWLPCDPEDPWALSSWADPSHPGGTSPTHRAARSGQCGKGECRCCEVFLSYCFVLGKLPGSLFWDWCWTHW